MLIGLALGFGGGVAAGLLGIGGGAVFIPGMVFLLDREQGVAQGISLTVIVVTAAVAMWKHARHDNVDFHVARWMIPSAVGLSVCGALIAAELEGDVLRRIFGSLVLLVSLRFLYQTISAGREPTTAVEGSNAAAEVAESQRSKEGS